VRVLVLVLAARVAPYPALVRVIERTWASTSVPGIETLFYVGGPSLKLRGRTLAVPAPDDLAHVGQKTVACFAYALEQRRFDLVFRTNCSSYVDLPNLSTFVSTRAAPLEFYGGKVGVHEGIRFASGSGYFLSHDLVELAVEHPDEWSGSIDDVALASLLARHGVEPVEVPRQDLVTFADLARLDLSHFHFRCKSTVGGRRDDRVVMLAVHRAFCRRRGAPLATRAKAAARVALVRLGRSVRWRLRRRSVA
jgi:hypothetical protein